MCGSMRLILWLVNAVWCGALILLYDGAGEHKIMALRIDPSLCDFFFHSSDRVFHFPVALSHVYDFTLIRVAQNYDMRGQT